MIAFALLGSVLLAGGGVISTPHWIREEKTLRAFVSGAVCIVGLVLTVFVLARMGVHLR